MKARRLRRVALFGAIAISVATQVSMGHAQQSGHEVAAMASSTDSTPTPHRVIARAAPVEAPLEGRPAPRGRGQYYVDFRARTAASWGHAFVWYGRSDDPRVEVAGLHPASDSPIPYVLGYFIPVPAETGKSYGDLDEQYVTAHYRVYLSPPDAMKVFAYIKHLQQTSLLWSGPLYNCQTFIGLIADYMGLKTPMPGLYPEDYINELRKLNGGRRVAHLDAH